MPVCFLELLCLHEHSFTSTTLSHTTTMHCARSTDPEELLVASAEINGRGTLTRVLAYIALNNTAHLTTQLTTNRPILSHPYTIHILCWYVR